jgi:pimeloyl-ACP methyl ester carboxylesterase
MFDWLVTVATYVAVVLVVLVLIIMAAAYHLRHLQDLLLYHPGEPAGSRERFDGPREFGVPRFENLEVRTPDGLTLRGFAVMPTSATPRHVIVYWHGNAGNAGHRTPIARLLAERTASTVVMMDYRGYGLSDGIPNTHPNESGLKMDAESVMGYVLAREDWRRLPIFVMGTSLGGAVSIYLGSQPRYDRIIAGWILENTFTSISDMADVVFAPIIRRAVVGWRAPALIFLLNRIIKPIVLHIGWYSIDLVRQVTAPILFISSSRDDLVPPSHVRSLHDSARACGLKRFHALPEAGHNDAPAAPGYADAIAAFMAEAVARRGGHALGTS